MTARADAFLIWREGTAVNWDCTPRELARATGIPAARVRVIVKAKRWPVRRREVHFTRNDAAASDLFGTMRAIEIHPGSLARGHFAFGVRSQEDTQ